MLNRLGWYALALGALFALQGCGAARIAGPDIRDARAALVQPLGDHPRTDDGGNPPPVVEPDQVGSAADTLRAGEDDSR